MEPVFLFGFLIIIACALEIKFMVYLSFVNMFVISTYGLHKNHFNNFPLFELCPVVAQCKMVLTTFLKRSWPKEDNLSTKK